jgi:hypothetical protein
MILYMKFSEIYVLSLCVKKNNSVYIFHFRGVYNGHYIKKIKVTGGHFKKDHAYLLRLIVNKISNESIEAELVKSKLINH